MTITHLLLDLPSSYAYIAAWLLYTAVVSLLCRRVLR